MHQYGPKIGDVVLNGRYELLREVKGSFEGNETLIGRKFNCRYCSESNPKCFRKIAHTLPESLGNRWIISLDECDECNEKFSICEDALAAAVRPFLTLGGIEGKQNKVPQTGRTLGDAILSRNSRSEIPNISLISKGREFNQILSVDATTGVLRMVMPVAGFKFKPRLAYKALTKMAYALLPDEELENYGMTRGWLLDVDDKVDLPVLKVAMSFASIGNAPHLVAGTLLRRVNPKDCVPHILFILCAGSICLQIYLRSDHLEAHIPGIQNVTINIEWSSVLGDEEGRKMISLNYGIPIHHNWSSNELTLQPVESFVTDFNPRTRAGKITPILRKQL